MRKGREIVGLPVINVETGEKVGLVSGLFWNHEQKKITAIGLDAGGVIGRSDPIPCKHVLSIGQNAVTVDGAGGTGDTRNCEQDRNISDVAGLLVVTDTGRNLGTLQDLVLDGDGPLLAGYEVSDGLVGDIISGREVLPPGAVLAWGSEAVVVRDEDRKEGTE